MSETAPLLVAEAISHSFKKSDRQDLLVLEKVDVALYPREIVAIVGKSGGGKSTCLRILAGLVAPTQGQVYFKGMPVHAPVKGMSMVFQHFALMPWLTVLQNVELALEAQRIPQVQRREMALRAIDIVGMDGFETAYPRELSGGMCQRVGIARALALPESELLLMDEPFSALDVLTAENLRSDLLDIWQSEKTALQSIVIVTHNIEEACLLADRILVFGANPGHVRREVTVSLSHPRQAQGMRFRQKVDEVFTLMTLVQEKHFVGPHAKAINLHHRLPRAPISEIAGLLEALAAPECEKKVDLPELAEARHLDVDDLFLITEALEILHFASVLTGDIMLTAIGKQFAQADILGRKQIFARQLLRHVPLARYVRRVLDERPGHTAYEDRFLQELEDSLSQAAAKEVLRVVIDWGRYAEIFAYDANTGRLSLENPT